MIKSIFTYLKKHQLIALLILVSLLKELIFMMVVPIWHTPDEQAHFAQVANYAENISPVGGMDLNREIYESENYLGTLRDDRGNNKFTFHPEYKIDYTDSTLGEHEQDINNLPISYRKEIVKQEAANYPPLYYFLGSVVYKIFYNSDLINRVFAIRFLTLLFNLGIVYFTFLISKELFKKNLLMQVTLPLLVSFQPMLSFVSIGVSSDTLTNLLFTALIYTNVLIISRKDFKRNVLISIFVIFLIYLTKPQFILAIPILFSAILIRFQVDANYKKNLLAAFLTILLIIGIAAIFVSHSFVLNFLQTIYPMSFSPGYIKHFADPIGFLKQSLYRVAHETVPWYWGIFDWLGVSLPIGILRILNRLLIIGGLGVVWKLIKIIKKRELPDMIFIYLILASFIYFAGILFYDYLFYSTHNFSFGLQGRYFFPTISAHFAVLLIGLVSLVPKRFLYLKNWLIFSLGFGMMFLNFFSLFLIANTYYHLSDFGKALLEASQYKPDLFKGGFINLWLIFYSFSLVFFIFRYFKIRNQKTIE